MDYLYAVLKSCVDPVFVVFVLLVIAVALCWFSVKKNGGALFLLLTTVIIYGASIAPVANYLAYSLEGDYIRNRQDAGQSFDVLVVLGGGSYDIRSRSETHLSNATVARLSHAVLLYHRQPSKYFVCSGDGPGTVPEADLMADLALAFGVPKERIRIEAKSQTTWENAYEVGKIFPHKNISIGLVTSGYHMRRAQREFEKIFPKVTPLPAHFLYASPDRNVVVRFMPQAAELLKTGTVIKEKVGHLWYSIRGI
jgi:uncharacterized SAM-binding protein YcdF (DUF218 family)